MLIQWYLRLETFIMWFIDGASFIDTDDEQWDYYVIFEKYKDEDGAEKHAVVGLSTVFRFYAYPEQIRPRVRFKKIQNFSVLKKFNSYSQWK